MTSRSRRRLTSALMLPVLLAPAVAVSVASDQPTPWQQWDDPDVRSGTVRLDGADIAELLREGTIEVRDLIPPERCNTCADTS